MLYDGSHHPIFYSSTFQSAVTQPGAKLALYVDAMTYSTKPFNYSGPVYRATFCVNTLNESCFLSSPYAFNPAVDAIGFHNATFFQPPNQFFPAPIGTLGDFDIFGDQLQEVRFALVAWTQWLRAVVSG